MATEVKVDSEFAALCPPLTADEYSTLEASIIAEGCREPLWTWKENGHQLLLDGHNRLGICKTHKRDYKTEPVAVANRDEARNWIINRQLGRRNVTDDQKSYLRGMRYNAEKMAVGGDRKSNTQNGHLKSGLTHERLAAEYGVAKNTIRRDAEFAEAVDTLAKSAGEKTRNEILSGGLKVTKQDVVKLAALPEDKQRAAVLGGEDAIRKAVAPKTQRGTVNGRKVSALAIRASMAALDQLIRNLEGIGVASRVAKHTNAIRTEVENVRGDVT